MRTGCLRPPQSHQSHNITMRILVTGARGFVGRNLCSQLRNIRDGRARNYDIAVDEVYEYDIDSTPVELDAWCAKADFVFNLAGVNRPKDPEEFMRGNFGFASALRTRRSSCAATSGSPPPFLIPLKDTATPALSCSPPASRPPSPAASATASTAGARGPARSCFSSTRRRPAPGCWCTASPTSTASGAARTTTARWPPSATTSPTAYPYRSTIPMLSWNCCTSTTWWTRCSWPYRARSTAASSTESIPYCAVTAATAPPRSPTM